MHLHLIAKGESIMNRKPQAVRNLLALIAIAMVATACGGDSNANSVPVSACEADQTDGPLRLYNWAEYIDEEQVVEFADEYGIEYSVDAFDSNETMQALVSAGNSNFDVIVPSDYMMAILIAGEHVQPLNFDALPNKANLAEEFLDPGFDPDLLHSIPYQWGYTGLAVNTDVLGDDFPRSWSLIFGDEADQYSGQISVLNDAREALGAALIYLGYSLNSTDEDELNEAADLVANARDNILAFETDSADDFLINGETVIAHGYSGDMFVSTLDADDPDAFEFFVPEEGGPRWVDNFAIPFDAPHPCTAHTFINWVLQGEQHARLTNWNYYGSPNTASLEFLDEGVAAAVDPSIVIGGLDSLEGLIDTGDFEIEYSDAFVRAKG